jgi:hypothetical protein
MINKQKRHIELAELRNAYITVKNFIEAESFEEVKSLNTRLVGDLGLLGHDNYELIVKFVDKFNLDHKDFKYNNHFYTEGELFDSTAALINLTTLIFWIPTKLIELISFRKIKTWKYSIIKPDRKVLDLSFRDMLTWYIQGKYKLGTEIEYKIKTVT